VTVFGRECDIAKVEWMANSGKEPDIGLRLTWGILLAALCLFLALSIFSYEWRDISLLKVPPNSPPHNLIGPVGAWLSFVLLITFGAGAYLAPWLFLAMGAMLVLNREDRVWPRLAWAFVFMLAVVCLLQLNSATWEPMCRKHNLPADAGGIFGRVLMQDLLMEWVGPVGAGIVAWCLCLVALLMAVRVRRLISGCRSAAAFARAQSERIRVYLEERQDRRRLIEREERQLEKRRKRLERSIREKKRRMEQREERPAPETPPSPEKTPEPVRAANTLPRASSTAATAEDATERRYELPPLSVLERAPASKRDGVRADTETTSRILVGTLAEFGIEAEVTNVEVGPVVTRYELLPAAGVRVERIAGLSNNLALSLKATSVRVQAPIPGKGVVGIEVPNTVSKTVYLLEVLEGKAWRESRARLPLILGQDVGGSDIIGDLTAMPHLLIAGATGSGKTVCMNSILAGLLMSRSPEELRLLLVDPKIVEFAAYNNLPHLVVPVVTDPHKVALGLRWAINEMERRYKLFARAGVRNIESYNGREIVRQTDLFGEEPAASGEDSPERLPYVVVVIDELADLMLAAQAEIENCVARLAQLSRAVGIHMIIATQRPSVNVITGTIKANFPARIAFQVAQRVDSRTILDTIGADKLLGRGDMLYLPPGSSKLVRAQGAMTSDQDVRRITDFIRNQAEPEYELEIKEKLDKSSGQETADVDDGSDEELIGKAVDIIRETRRASTSSLQRRLRIGYTRAARIIDVLEERGILGPPRGAEPREILIDLDGDIPNNDDDVPED